MTTEHETAALLELVALPGAGPKRLQWLLAERPASAVVASLRLGRIESSTTSQPPGLDARLIERWSNALGSLDGAQILDRHRSAGVFVVTADDRRWPFVDDPDPPSVLFAMGDLDLLGRTPSVGMVGTRRCTTVGRRVAREIGAELGAVGVAVVSGLAAGIDAEAHLGALTGGGPVVGVVACGLDSPYPKSNRGLWNEVAETGLLLSEYPLGSSPERWKFPARNRLIAALSDAIVVVESHESGGALSTVEEAIVRDVSVGAIPGSVLSSAAAGTNALLVDGAVPVRDVADVLALAGVVSTPGLVSLAHVSGEAVSRVDGEFDHIEHAIVAAAESGPIHIDQLLLGLPANRGEVLAACDRLIRRNVLELDGARFTLPAPSQRYRAPL